MFQLMLISSWYLILGVPTNFKSANREIFLDNATGGKNRGNAKTEEMVKS